MFNYRLSFLIVALFGLFLTGCLDKSQKPKLRPAESEWRYFGQAFPGAQPEIFSPDIISTNRDERDFTMSPSGNEIFYTLVLPAKNLSVIVYLVHDGAFWSQPKAASFSGQYSDLEPAFSTDGNKLFFASKRPLNSEDTTNDWNIWYVERVTTGWSDPIALNPMINTENDEFYPSVAQNGNLYFTAKRDDSFGHEDLYFSEFDENKYNSPVNLGDSINTSLYEFNAYIAPDESYLIFSSWGRKDGFGGGDLYISFRNKNGVWNKTRNLGANINSKQLDYCPVVTVDGKYLFFTSQKMKATLQNNTQRSLETLLGLADDIENGLGNIYWVEFKNQVLNN